MATEGDADSAYVKTYDDGLDPVYVLPTKIKGGELEYVKTLQHSVVTVILLDSTTARAVPSPVELST